MKAEAGRDGKELILMMPEERNKMRAVMARISW